METEETRNIVRTNAVSAKSYDDALAVLDNYYGAPAKIYPQYLKELMKLYTYSYDLTGIRRMQETFYRVIKEMESCKRYDLDTVLGNNTILPGPNKYPLIYTILTQFRLHQITASADISKMFREVVLHPEERDFPPA